MARLETILLIGVVIGAIGQLGSSISTLSGLREQERELNELRGQLQALQSLNTALEGSIIDANSEFEHSSRGLTRLQRRLATLDQELEVAARSALNDSARVGLAEEQICSSFNEAGQICPLVRVNKTIQDGSIRFVVDRPISVPAAHAGVVLDVPEPSAGWGHVVAIAHPNGFVTTYAHLENVSVRQGQVVRAGEMIGAVGQDVSSGDHVHVEVEREGQRIKPELLPAGWFGVLDVASAESWGVPPNVPIVSTPHQALVGEVGVVRVRVGADDDADLVRLVCELPDSTVNEQFKTPFERGDRPVEFEFQWMSLKEHTIRCISEDSTRAKSPPATRRISIVNAPAQAYFQDFDSGPVFSEELVGSQLFTDGTEWIDAGVQSYLRYGSGNPGRALNIYYSADMSAAGALQLSVPVATPAGAKAHVEFWAYNPDAFLNAPVHIARAGGDHEVVQVPPQQWTRVTATLSGDTSTSRILIRVGLVASKPQSFAFRIDQIGVVVQ